MECAGGGAACTQPTCDLGPASLHKQCTKRNRGFMDEGREETRQRKQKKGEEQKKWEVWKFVEVLKVVKVDYHSVVGSGNYWVAFVAQSQFFF